MSTPRVDVGCSLPPKEKSQKKTVNTYIYIYIYTVYKNLEPVCVLYFWGLIKFDPSKFCLFYSKPISFKTASLHKNEWIMYSILQGFGNPQKKTIFFKALLSFVFTIKNQPSSTKLTSGGVFVAASIRKPPRKVTKPRPKQKRQDEAYHLRTRKKLWISIESWLFNRDPYHGSL